MHALIGRTLSEATLLGYVAQLHHALAEWEHHAIERLLASPAMHVDETSLRVERKNHWIHVYSAGTLTVKCLHAKRGREAIEAIGIIPRYAGVAVHDCWASYLSYAHCDHALCGAHLLRELAFIVDAHHYAWAKRMKRLLLRACHQLSKRDDKTLSASEYKALRKRYRTVLTQGARELPPLPPRQNGQRSKVAKSDAHNLWERMQKHETAVLRFAKHPDVAFTNNRAERDLRMSKVKQNVSGASAPASTPKPIAASQAICSPWRTRVTTRWWPFRSLSPGVPLIIWVSSYFEISPRESRTVDRSTKAPDPTPNSGPTDPTFRNRPESGDRPLRMRSLARRHVALGMRRHGRLVGATHASPRPVHYVKQDDQSPPFRACNSAAVAAVSGAEPSGKAWVGSAPERGEGLKRARVET